MHITPILKTVKYQVNKPEITPQMPPQMQQHRLIDANRIPHYSTEKKQLDIDPS